MPNLLVCCALFLLAWFPAKNNSLFSGCIVYENYYQTLDGEPLYFAVKPKNWLYVRGNNMKMYDRNKKLMQLYIGKKNEFYTFEKGKATLLADTARHPGQTFINHLPTTAIILGYPCQVLQMVRGNSSTLVYYSAALRVKAADFSRCPVPGLAELLQATDGALPLRTFTIDVRRDVTATTEAISVQAMKLPAAEFTATAPAR